VVLDDAVVHEADARRLGRIAAAVEPTEAGVRGVHARPGREVRVRVVHRRRAVRGPARVRDTGARGDAIGAHAGLELGHARGAARAPQPAALVHGDAAGVIAAVFEPLQALDQHRNDVARADGADDSTHGQGSFALRQAGC
jgi:hypothetical protein